MGDSYWDVSDEDTDGDEMMLIVFLYSKSLIPGYQRSDGTWKVGKTEIKKNLIVNTRKKKKNQKS